MCEKISAEQFNNECLKILGKVNKTGRSIVITKNNVPFVELAPIKKDEGKLFGKLKGTVHFIGNPNKLI